MPGRACCRWSSGDRLTRREFERRYAAQPDIKKAELIEGVVHLPSPVRFAGLGEPHAWIVFWLTTYSTHTPGVRVAGNASIRLDSRNEPQPDALVRIEPEARGRSRVSDDGYVEGAPELVVEVASSSAACGWYEKRRAYLRNGVQEIRRVAGGRPSGRLVRLERRRLQTLGRGCDRRRDS